MIGIFLPLDQEYRIYLRGRECEILAVGPVRGAYFMQGDAQPRATIFVRLTHDRNKSVEEFGVEIEPSVPRVTLSQMAITELQKNNFFGRAFFRLEEYIAKNVDAEEGEKTCQKHVSVGSIAIYQWEEARIEAAKRRFCPSGLLLPGSSIPYLIEKP